MSWDLGIFRKTNVPDGLRDLMGDPVNQTCAIIGTYDTGSSLLSSIMERFGYVIGRPCYEDYFESASLRDILVRAFNEPQMAMRLPSGQLVAELDAWLAQIKPIAPALCVKHPLLGLCLPELEHAWGRQTIFIHAKRPLEKSIRGLTRRDWFPEPERMQCDLHRRINDWFSEGKPCVSVYYEELLAAPESVIRKLAEDLGIAVSATVIERAVALIERRAVD